MDEQQKTNKILEILVDLGLSDRDGFSPISSRVRDRDDVYALRCRRSGVITLNTTDHISDETYASNDDLSYWGQGDRRQLLAATFADDSRRAEFLRPYITGKRYLDIGTGLGGILDLLRPFCRQIDAVELQAGARAALRREGYTVFESCKDAPLRSYDVISLFHVYEHIPDPIVFMRDVINRLSPGGSVIVEVPHAGDALISLYENNAFLDFTLWSQHLVLHTRESLRAFLKAAGLHDVRMAAVQRYSCANHLHWLAKGKPGGHMLWHYLDTPRLTDAYAEALMRLDVTDTLLAVACMRDLRT